MMPYVPPKFREDAFSCPLCNVYSVQNWTSGHRALNRNVPLKADTTLDNVNFCICGHCNGFSIWVDERMIYPRINGVPFPHPDMPKEVKDTYEEARSVVSLSPRSSAALIRLAIEKLVYHILGEERGKDLDKSIGVLVNKGLKVEIQQSLDYLRVIGNNAVHPLGRIDVDDYDTASSLFELVNLVVDTMITSPKKVKTYYDTLPKETRDSVSRRNGKQ